jgi:NAD(P)-dependent dehydrogenase (short-subunit alcohol dehydrogenase family)
MKAAMECGARFGGSLRSRNIAVNALCAGLVKTDSFRVLRQLGTRWAHAGRAVVEADEIADVVLFLCGPAARGYEADARRGSRTELRCFGFPVKADPE